LPCHEFIIIIIIIIIIINRFKVVISEALGAGSVLVSRERSKAWEKKKVFSLDLKTAKKSHY